MEFVERQQKKIEIINSLLELITDFFCSNGYSLKAAKREAIFFISEIYGLTEKSIQNYFYFKKYKNKKLSRNEILPTLISFNEILTKIINYARTRNN
ncbi:MAG: hypothetical protein LBM67_08435 [Lentimicrobiaceae bacterium]|jgi:hypothetical protein|nr:hypothetical protein [Lentimicrobiaceae bacterium]